MLLLKAFWFLLPAGMANVAPVLARQVFPLWNTPIDFHKTWRGTEIFGSHKTYRGVLVGVLAGLGVFALQKFIFARSPLAREISLFDYSQVSPFFGCWMGACALLGDMIKSFFKRRISLAPGRSWVPFDQVDWIIGLILGVEFIYPLSWSLTLACLGLGIALHFLMNFLGYLVRINDKPL